MVNSKSRARSVAPLAAALLTEEEVVLQDVPAYADVAI